MKRSQGALVRRTPLVTPRRLYTSPPLRSCRSTHKPPSFTINISKPPFPLTPGSRGRLNRFPDDPRCLKPPALQLLNFLAVDLNRVRKRPALELQDPFQWHVSGKKIITSLDLPRAIEISTLS
ncbi:hypothetical protein AB1N83_013969 [Pleurotus pulmonarius]